MRMVEFLARDLDLLFPQKNCLIIHMSALASILLRHRYDFVPIPPLIEVLSVFFFFVFVQPSFTLTIHGMMT